MTKAAVHTETRCAIYTRKSSEEGLEQAFNTLHAQREACEAYIASQRHEGWSVMATAYDDGGVSGGTMDRPGLQCLLADITAGKVDVVVVYKIDRLTRSLFDFAKIVEIFDARKVSFVSVTQAFNTTTSMGRLTLNVLLSFAQFEREVTGERIRDKVAASKKKGMWMGGNIPLGYDIKDRKLVPNLQEAETVRLIFELYVRLGAVRKVKAEIDRLALRTKPRASQESDKAHDGLSFRIGHLYTILRNPLYIGNVPHKGQIYAGEHPGIIPAELWDQAQKRLTLNAIKRRSGEAAKEPSLLAGLLHHGQGIRMTPSHAVKDGRRYRYYLSTTLIAGRVANPGAGLRLPAHEVEAHVVTAVCRFLADACRLTDELCTNNSSPDAMSDMIGKAQALSGMLASNTSTARYQAIRRLIDDVRIEEDGIRLVLNRLSLKRQLEMTIDDEGVEDLAVEGDGGQIVVHIPAALQRLGKQKRLILAAPATATRRDHALIKALVRAHRWFEMLKSRKVGSIADLARSEDLPRTYVSSLMPLALLAPDITEAILIGSQPATATLDRIMNLAPFPFDWVGQRVALGFSGQQAADQARRQVLSRPLTIVVQSKTASPMHQASR